MATYNGAAYLREQVYSLFAQTRLPDELVVYDDASSDGTQALLRQIAAEAPFDVQILEGADNRGVNAAFQAALEHCRGDTVFFCDQDDIWLPRKIEACQDVLDALPQSGFVFCDASQFSARAGDLDTSLWELARFSPRRRAAFRRDPLGTMLTGGNFVYGMACAFRRDVLTLFQEIDCDPAGMTHDTWFALHASALGLPGVALPEQLVRYRRHDLQASVVLGGVDTNAQSRMLKAQSRAAALIAALRNVRNNVLSAASLTGRDVTISLACFDRKIAFLEARESLRRERSLKGMLRGLVDPDYWALATGPASALRDYRGIW
ncbi:glycosyltransferase [Rhizobium sp. CG5]|nr:glycosyltransferase [Rhizobium sp. CG5]